MNPDPAATRVSGCRDLSLPMPNRNGLCGLPPQILMCRGAEGHLERVGSRGYGAPEQTLDLKFKSLNLTLLAVGALTL